MSEKLDRKQANELSRQAWDQNASFWNEQMGEGNKFVEVLIWPATERLLALKQGERILDVACGNGFTSRKMAGQGLDVVGIDFSEQMIQQARSNVNSDQPAIEYHVIDATNYESLIGLGQASFDAALCNMALFDMAEIEPLMRALVKLLRPGGRFVFSVIHPCFNNPHAVPVAEMENLGKELVTVYSIKVHGYMTATIQTGVAIPGQPAAHPYFHRPLSLLFGTAFRAGFVLDGLEESAFAPDHPAGDEPLGWSGKFSEIPPILVARMRIREQSSAG